MSLRKLQPISFEPAIRPAQSLGKPGEFKWLKPGELVIDTKYQRDVGGRGKQNIRQIVENFEWAMFSPLIVSKRPDDLYAVIDGQHRAIAAVTHGGIDALPCWIIEGGPQKQARAFAVINGQVTAVHPLAMFRARVAAEDTEALAIVEVAATATEQMRNRRCALLVEHGGETITLYEYSRRNNISYNRLHHLVHRRGLSPSAAVERLRDAS